jgi:hypothetical protein
MQAKDTTYSIKTVRSVVGIALIALLSVHCGDDEDTSGGRGNTQGTDAGSFDNQAVCQAWVDSMTCGNVDFSQYIDCSIYANTPCDISDYFQCLTDNTVCNEAWGAVDPSGWTRCQSKATCGS